MIKSLLRQGLKRAPHDIPGMTSSEECQFLRGLARSVSHGVIVEIGSYRGRATLALAKGSSEGAGVDVFAVDPHEQFVGVYGGVFGPADRQAFYEHVAASGLGTLVRLISLPSASAARAMDRKIELLWIDGDHSFEGVSSDFECWAPHLTDDAVVAFDDSTDSSGGPYTLIEKLCSGAWSEAKHCGKIRTIRRRS